MRAGLRVGDSVVEAGGQLVLFMEQEQVERLLQEDRLQIALTVERWSVGVKCINYINYTYICVQRRCGPTESV